LDQTDVELAGQSFDIDWLVADGYDITYERRDQRRYDELKFESWYNRTRLEGSSQRPSKRIQYPFFDFIEFIGFTDVDSLSTGYSAAISWDGCHDGRLTMGTDLRYVKQELNQLTSGRVGFNFWQDANSPVPRSHWSNPGLFSELALPISDSFRMRAGTRIDWSATNIEESAAELAALGVDQPQSSAADILGSSAFDQDDFLGAAFLSLERDLGFGWTTAASIGYAERAPNLTERYAVEPFMFLMQGLINPPVTGDPELAKERGVQIDMSLKRETRRFRGVITAYHSWFFDYITFENTSVVLGPPLGQSELFSLRFVNTDLATIAGVESFAEYDLTPSLTPFTTLKYIVGEDHTRNGHFATREATPGVPSEKVPGLPRGSFSGVIGAHNEPLPGIVPLESRIGVRWHQTGRDPDWGVEVSARIVDDQDRVALSLLEPESAGFTTYDLRSFWRPRERLTLVFGAENFTNKNYREHLDYKPANPFALQTLQPGRNVYVGAEWTY
jgi:outer membrane receptor protein involved in Fe transport